MAGTPSGGSPMVMMSPAASRGAPAMGGGLLASIQAGKRLRAVEAPAPKPKSERNNLLDMIKAKGTSGLKHVEVQEEKASAPAAGLTGALDQSMAAILSRRKYLEQEESDDSSDDDDWS